MMRSIPLSLASILIAISGFGQPENLTLLREKTTARLHELAGSTRGILGFAALDLTSGEQFGERTDIVFPQGSAIKIPVLMEVFRQAHEGKFKLSDVRPLENPPRTGGSGVLQYFSDGTSRLSIYDLCVLMIILSDNSATNQLIDLVGMQNINTTLHSLGMTRTTLQRKMIRPASSAKGEENLSTPAEAVALMKLLFNGDFIGRKECDEMLRILRYPKQGDIRAGVPDSIPVPFKPGGIAGVTTEWAIVELKERPYAVAVMETYGMGTDARKTFQDISRTLFEYFWRMGNVTKYGTYVDPALPR